MNGFLLSKFIHKPNY